MTKTITLRITDDMYELFKKAADGQKRTISNYLEYAALNYTINDTVVNDSEMEEILSSQKNIQQGLSDINAERYMIIG